MSSEVTEQVCKTCKICKPVSEFTKTKITKSGYYYICKSCRAIERFDRYHRTGSNVRAKNKEDLNRLRQNRYNYIWNYLKTHPCVDCGISDFRVLEFDHVRGTKRMDISKAVNYRIEVLIEEISKCDVRCANCHRIKTYIQLEWQTPTGSEED